MPHEFLPPDVHRLYGVIELLDEREDLATRLAELQAAAADVLALLSPEAPLLSDDLRTALDHLQVARDAGAAEMPVQDSR